MSWWQFWKWGKEEKKSGMRIVLGGSNPARTPDIGKPTVTNLVPPPVGSSTPVGMNPTAGQGIGLVATNATSLESAESENQSADDWLKKGYEQIVSGDLQGAIASYDKAIQIKLDCDEAWNNRGNALGNLGRDEEAIASFDKALEIKPDSYVAWHNRGNALGNSVRYEEAIASYDRAIEIKPDSHDTWHSRGNALGNSGRYEEAIESFDKAIEIKPDFHEAWNSRGIVFCDYLGLYEKALADFNKCLKIKPDNFIAWGNRGVAITKFKRDYDEEIANYRQGLNFCQQYTHPEGWGCLHWYLGRAHYFQGKQSDRSLFAAAREEYELALKTLTEEAFPERRLEVFQDYVKLLWQLNQPNDVREVLQKASELLRALIAKSPQSKERLERKFISFQQVTIDLCLQSGDIAQALVLAEQSKATCLSWMITTEPMDWQQIQNLVRADGGAFIYWYYSPLALHTILLLPNQAPRLIATTPVDGSEDPHPSPLPEGEREQEYLLPPFSPRGRRGWGMRGISDFLTTWNEQYASYQSKDKTKESADEKWRQELPNHLTSLTEILSIEKILPILSEHNIQNLTLIPHRDLHRLPLHALFPQSIKTRYLPTLHLGGSPLPPFKRGEMNLEVPLQKGDLGGSSGQERRLLSVEAPDSDYKMTNDFGEEIWGPMSSLSYAAIESAYICQAIGAPLHRIANEAATKDQVITALTQGCQIFHFTGHAGYNFNSPKKSALCLSKSDRLSLEELVKIPLDGCQLVCLSACETGITGKQTILDEYVGLVSAFLAQGVGAVVSTLWQVQSAASAIIMMEFYRRRKNLDDITALNETTHWLRSATAHDLINWCGTMKTEDQPRKVNRFLKAEIVILSTLEETDKPYSDPYHWAAYTITGG